MVLQGPTGWPAVVELFLAQKRGNTAAAYRTDLRQFTAWCAAHDVDPLTATRTALIAYRVHLEDELGRSPSTVNRKLSALSGAYTTALVEDLITRSPATHVERPPVPDESQTLGLDRTELLALIEASRQDSPRARALVALLALNGLRVSEVCSADVAGLRRVQGHRVLKVRRKGAKDRDIPLAEPTQAAVDAYLAGRRTGPLLLATTGTGRLTRHSAARIVTRCAAAAGLPEGITPHSLRHTYVTLCAVAGIDLRRVQDSADHADPRTTQRYNHARGRLEDAPTYELADFLAGRIGPGGADPQGRLFD